MQLYEQAVTDCTRLLDANTVLCHPQTVRARLMSKPLVISKHSACRMDCRRITLPQVESVLAHGRLDSRRSDPTSLPCPRFALFEGSTRIIFADCKQSTNVVTAIDMETSHPCGPC
jgi:Domain of unknown function (DUF4258)